MLVINSKLGRHTLRHFHPSRRKIIKLLCSSFCKLDLTGDRKKSLALILMLCCRVYNKHFSDGKDA